MKSMQHTFFAAGSLIGRNVYGDKLQLESWETQSPRGGF